MPILPGLARKPVQDGIAVVLKVATGPAASTSSGSLVSCWPLAGKVASLCGKATEWTLMSLKMPQPPSPNLVWRFNKGDFLLEREHSLSMHSAQEGVSIS